MKERHKLVRATAEGNRA